MGYLLNRCGVDLEHVMQTVEGAFLSKHSIKDLAPSVFIPIAVSFVCINIDAIKALAEGFISIFAVE